VIRLGLVSPIVTLNPRAHNAWEETAGVDDLVTVAQTADRLGYHHLTCSEHIAVPAAVALERGARYYDSATTLGYLAACTSRVRLATHVLVLAYHHPVELAKTYGTLDLLSGGRVILGVGVGTLREEFELLGAPFEGRGALADETLRELRRCLGRREVDGFVVDPAAVQPHLPIWVGGRTLRSLRRAVTLADGWAPFRLVTAEMARSWLGRVEVPDGFEVVLYPEQPVDPLGDGDGVRRVVAGLVDAGATIVNARFVSSSVAHCVEQMECMAKLVESVAGG
jgi:probable F420-dependent oxidoreductase